ncbi:MAG: secretin and TonB N-terminal domain-containing protein [Smithella sp.]|nr:secretin and TonB N-terminal domain-containing protein [Smithella sp.]MDM7986981.1 secretin and TonB N-terminal domain-containing protein [Smithella sp.]HQG65726.1 secretin and TonB N-terminal domain-containing protein [Smithella sp.]
MKKYLIPVLIVFLAIGLIFTYITGSSFAASGGNDKYSDNTIKVTANTGTLENIYLSRLPGKERVQLVVTKQPFIDVSNKVSGSYLIKLEDMIVPGKLCRTLGEGELNNIISVVPSHKLVNGKNWVFLNIAINKVVPYSIRQEDQNVFIDFNVSSLEKQKASTAKKAVTHKKDFGKTAGIDYAGKDEPLNVPVVKDKEKKPTDRLISLDFQDADIKSVFRLMAEYGNTSIITSDEVKGNITLTLKNVPWTKALDTILDVNALTKREEGNVIIITTLARSQKDEAAKEAVIERDKKRMADKGLLKQVLIEAKIVEATEGFVRNLGVQWGFGNQKKININDGKYGLGAAGGSGATGTMYQQAYPSRIGVTDSAGEALAMAAVNFPQAVASPAIGLVFGGATGFLEAQLAALETNSTGKIISAPKVVTMEGIKAIIKQGDEVPYITPASGTSPATVSFKEALLKLEVTPKLTAEGKISMDIKASNDTPDWSKAALNPQGNPPIVKSEVESKVVINDGDTIVIGGILRSTESKSVSGWPWLQKIPVLGWLFKKQDVNKEKRQLLIFVTPKVLNSENPEGSQGT